MYSEILSEYDLNTVFEMIEDYKAESREAKEMIAEKDALSSGFWLHSP